MENILEVVNISKSFDKKSILFNLNLNIKKNLITVLMGPNGVGKTTLINIILGLVPLDSGDIFINGEKIKNSLTIPQKKTICFIPDSQPFLDYLTGLENLKYISYIYKKNLNETKLHEIMNDFNLNPLDSTLVSDYSRGMKTKLSLCFIEIIDAELIILDEPTIGLDIVSIEYLRNNIFKFKGQNKSIFITSHDMEFVRSIADEIYVLNNKKSSLLFDSQQKLSIRDIDILSNSLISTIKSTS